jgi:thioredoxin-like negative regulator of GroEL
VNTGDLPLLAERFQISGIPTLIFFKDGRIAARQSGAMPAAMITKFVEQ